MEDPGVNDCSPHPNLRQPSSLDNDFWIFFPGLAPSCICAIAFSGRRSICKSLIHISLSWELPDIGEARRVYTFSSDFEWVRRYLIRPGANKAFFRSAEKTSIFSAASGDLCNHSTVFQGGLKGRLRLLVREDRARMLDEFRWCRSRSAAEKCHLVVRTPH